MQTEVKIHELEKTKLEAELKDLIKKKDRESPKHSQNSQESSKLSVGRGKQRIMARGGRGGRR